MGGGRLCGSILRHDDIAEVVGPSRAGSGHCDRLRGLIEDVLCRRSSLVSTLPETSHTCGGCEVCPQHLPRQLLSSPVCQRPLKAAQRDGLTRSSAACQLKKKIWREEKAFQRHLKGVTFPRALHAGKPPAWPLFGFSATRAALPTVL